MQSTDLLQIVTWLETAGVAVWLDGGWGMDALVGGRVTLARPPWPDPGMKVGMHDVYYCVPAGLAHG